MGSKMFQPCENAHQQLTQTSHAHAHARLHSTHHSSSVGMKHVLFIETGFGADQHGQNATKAAVRACRNAIEFNSIPSVAALIPGGMCMCVCLCMYV